VKIFCNLLDLNGITRFHWVLKVRCWRSVSRHILLNLDLKSLRKWRLGVYAGASGNSASDGHFGTTVDDSRLQKFSYWQLHSNCHTITSRRQKKKVHTKQMW